MMFSVAAKPMAEQVEELALTVWPTLLGQEIVADKILINQDPRWLEFKPKQGEAARDYLMRLCGGVLAGECKQVVPEYQGAAVAAYAMRRATELLPLLFRVLPQRRRLRRPARELRCRHAALRGSL